MGTKILEIYLWGVIAGVLFFYTGARRGHARDPEMWAVIFGLLWFITIPVVIWKVLFEKEG